MGAIINRITPHDSTPIPIMGMDEMEIARSQNWDVSPLGIHASLAAVWGGSDPVEFNVNFELLAGYGPVKDREMLYEMAKRFHAMAAHQEGDDGLALAPPMVQLIIFRVIDQVGFFKNVRTSFLGPWGGKDLKGDSGFTEAYPTVVRFSGTFCFVPGYDSNANKAGVSVSLNNKNLSMNSVASSFYTFKG